MIVDLVVRSVADLGLGANGASLVDIYARARELGLELCPAELAGQLRLQYLDQPVGELLHIGTEPAFISGGEVAHLIVGNGGAGLFVVAGSLRADATLAPTVRFVFIRPRASATNPVGSTTRFSHTAGAREAESGTIFVRTEYAHKPVRE